MHTEYQIDPVTQLLADMSRLERLSVDPDEVIVVERPFW